MMRLKIGDHFSVEADVRSESSVESVFPSSAAEVVVVAAGDRVAASAVAKGGSLPPG